MTVGVVACGALALHVRAIARRRGLDLDVHALPPQLHNRPERIAPAVAEKLAELRGRHERVAVAYADCGSYGAVDALLDGHRRSSASPATRATTCSASTRCARRSPRSRAPTSSPISSRARSSTPSGARSASTATPSCATTTSTPTAAASGSHSGRRRRCAGGRARGGAARPAAERARRRRGRAGARAGAHLQRSGGMKERADVVVIGAGIVGCAAAHYLTLAGVRDVVVVDQGPIGDTGGSSFHAPGLCFQTNGSKLSCTLAQWTRELYRSLDTPERRTWWEVGSLEVATTPERLGELRRRHAYATSWGLESHVDHTRTRRSGTSRCSTASACTARCTCRATASPEASTSARRCRRPPRRAAPRSSAARARPASTWRAAACARSRPTRARSAPRRRSSAWASGRRSSCARSACRWSRCSRCSTSSPGPSRCPSWPARPARSITRSCATRIAPCTSASAARATASAPTDTTPITIEPAELERHPDGHQIATGPFSQEHWPESLGWAHELLPPLARVGIAETFNGHFSFAVDNNSFAGPDRRRSAASGSPTASGSRTPAAPPRPSST